MILPIGDSPNPRGFTPWITYLLISINLLIFALITLPLRGEWLNLSDPLVQDYLLSLADSLPQALSLREAQALLAHLNNYDAYVFAHGYKPGAPEISDLFSSMFLHAGWGHLLGNMLFLWIYGDNVEFRLGHWRYLMAYLATGVIATLAFAALNLDSVVPLVGASGAISGVLGIYFLWFPRNKVRMLLFLFPFIVQSFHVPARLALGFYVLVDNLLPLLLAGESNVAYGAHLGGFLAGLAIAVWWAQLPPSRRPRPPEPSSLEI